MVASRIPYVPHILPVADMEATIAHATVVPASSTSRVASALRSAAFVLRSQLENDEAAAEQSRALCRIAHDIERGLSPHFVIGPGEAALKASMRDIDDAKALIRSVDLAIYATCGDLSDSKVVDGLTHIARLLVTIGRLLQSAGGRLA